MNATSEFRVGQRVWFLADGPEGEQVRVEGEVREVKHLDTGEWVVIDAGDPPTFYGANPLWHVQPEDLRLVEED